MLNSEDEYVYLKCWGGAITSPLQDLVKMIQERIKNNDYTRPIATFNDLDVGDGSTFVRSHLIRNYSKFTLSGININILRTKTAQKVHTVRPNVAQCISCFMLKDDDNSTSRTCCGKKCMELEGFHVCDGSKVYLESDVEAMTETVDYSVDDIINFSFFTGWNNNLTAIWKDAGEEEEDI